MMQMNFRPDFNPEYDDYGEYCAHNDSHIVQKSRMPIRLSQA